jgi:hypothetical protein
MLKISQPLLAIKTHIPFTVFIPRIIEVQERSCYRGVIEVKMKKKIGLSAVNQFNTFSTYSCLTVSHLSSKCF